MAPARDAIPDKCRLNIAISTPGPECDSILLNGGYTVQPAPTPFSTKADHTKSNREGGNNQKLKLLSLGKAMSGEPISRGKNQFPNPPISDGITRKNIIINPCAVMMTLYK